MADPTLRDLAQAMRRAHEAWRVRPPGDSGPLATTYIQAEHALVDALDMNAEQLAEYLTDALDAEFAAGRRAADDKALDALRREKAALDALEALKAAHAAEVEKLKAEINALNKALREECE